MRIISGTKRGMILKTLEGTDTRPTSDRAKESLFNITAPKISGCTFLDLFSGSGSIGIEALSRGAEKCYFIENNSCSIITFNLKKANFENNAKVFNCDVFSFLKTTQEKFDIIFLDPPYHMGYINTALEIIESKNLLNEGGIIIAECDRDEAMPDTVSSLFLFDKRKYGRNMFNFYKIK